MPFSGLTAEFASNRNATIVRGLRNSLDYGYEMQMAMLNRHLRSNVETVFLPTRQEFAHISSTLVKEVFASGGNIDGLVPKQVITHLAERR